MAVAIDTRGVRLDDRSCAADSDGYQQLITWAERHGRIAAFGIEGTGSYGAGLTRAGPASRAPGARSEPRRPAAHVESPGSPTPWMPRPPRGRSWRANRTAIPKTADGAVEMMHHLKVARRTAVKARTSAMITLKADRRHRAARAARDPQPARRPGAPQTLPRMALRHDRYADRLGETYPPGVSPVAGSLSPSKSWTTTVT